MKKFPNRELLKGGGPTLCDTYIHSDLENLRLSLYLELLSQHQRLNISTFHIRIPGFIQATPSCNVDVEDVKESHSSQLTPGPGNHFCDVNDLRHSGSSLSSAPEEHLINMSL